MNKEDVVKFFDHCAPQWDADMIRDNEIIGKILDLGNVTAGADVLDVACGTGVLFPDYMARGVGSLTGIDISPGEISSGGGALRGCGRGAVW